ncbi:MAG: FapA family protein [Treponema sp.]|nr:FapA family protein [Treponema sp.]MEE3313660.1 FapA family protein [Treponema sp.]
MVTLDQLRADMEKILKIDKEIHSVEVRGDTIEECLSDAALQLDSKISNLEYEVLEKGFAGVMGVAKKPWVLRVYQNSQFIQKKMEEALAVSGGTDAQEEAKNLDVDGIYHVRRFGDGIYLKIVLPVGKGRPVNFNDVIIEAKRADTRTLDDALIKKLCVEGTNDDYAEIGSYSRVAAGDAIFAVDIAKDEMSATITASPPSQSGSEISMDAILQKLRIQGVVAGILEDKIIEFVDNPVYNIPFEVAAAVLPKDGNDAYIDYKVETDHTKLRLKEADNGQVDFKQLNLIENVVEGQVLAVKVLPQQGKGGKTIMGRYLEAKNGKDINIPLGQNVKIGDDGLSIVATCNGEVLLQGDKLSVEPVREEKGVNIKTGHITFMGTVIVRGNVEDGFNIKADGNVEVYGTVGNCRIEAGGDIVISQGVSGRHEGFISTPKSIWAHHVENVKIEAGEYVIINDSIVNSEVTAMKKIVLKGKRAQIVGGHLFATEEITAKNLGSPAGGTETVLEVGIDPKAKKRMQELQEMQAKLVAELEEIDLSIAHLEEQRKIRRSLPKDKEESLNQLITRKNEIDDETAKASEEINEIDARLKDLKVAGKVNISGTAYAGAKIRVRDREDDLKTNVKAVTFYYENGFVRRGKYNPNTDDIKGPDGYTTN